MELSINDLLIIQDGLTKVHAETRSSLVFTTSAIGMDPGVEPRLRGKIAEIEDLQHRISTALNSAVR